MRLFYWSFGYICGAASVVGIALVFNNLTGAPSQSAGTKPAAVAAPEDEAFPKARKSVAANLTNPANAQFEQMTTVGNDRGKLVCGVVSENGANTPRRVPFIYHVGADVSFVLINKKEAFVAGPAIVNACFPTYTVPRTALEASRE